MKHHVSVFPWNPTSDIITLKGINSLYRILDVRGSKKDYIHLLDNKGALLRKIYN